MIINNQIVVIYNGLLQFNDNLILTLCIVYSWYHMFCCPSLFTSLFLLWTPFLEMGQSYLTKTCEIHWNVAFYILNTITLCMKK